VERDDLARDAYGRFERAIQRGQLFHAELAAREVGRLALGDALELVALIARDDPARYGRAAVRLHGRSALEANRLELPESQLALAALAALPHDEAAARAPCLLDSADVTESAESDAR
jgi:hypothetical protein